VVDEHAARNLRTGVDFNAGEPAREMRNFLGTEMIFPNEACTSWTLCACPTASSLSSSNTNRANFAATSKNTCACASACTAAALLFAPLI
jgi:hypothetical protein